MNHPVKSDEELHSLLERTMRTVANRAPDMAFSTAPANPRWMASVAAATVLVAGAGAAGIALSSRHSASPLVPGAQVSAPGDTIEIVSPTTMSSSPLLPTGPTRAADPRDEAWRAAVYHEMSSFGTCATTDHGVGTGAEFSAVTICNHFEGDQPVDGNLVFVLQALPTTTDTSTTDWQQNLAGAGFNTAGVPVGSDGMMFVETSHGLTRRVAIVTPKRVISVAAELIDDKYLPSGDHDLSVAAQDLNKVADSILAAG
jgi:hypothetical protein